jgi:hypothetical protein
MLWELAAGIVGVVDVSAPLRHGLRQSVCLADPSGLDSVVSSGAAQHPPGF